MPNRYFFNFQETRSVLAESREEAEDIMYGEKDGWVEHHDSDCMFVFSEDWNGVLSHNDGEV